MKNEVICQQSKKKRANEKYWPNDFQKTKIREKMEAKKKEKVHRINMC